MRIGLVVPRFKQSAVARNRLKRRLRELSRIRLLPANLPVDVVLRVRPEAYGATFDALATDIARALERLTHWCSAVASGPAVPPPPTPPVSPPA
jgi:ribonuclease P protein component